MVHPESTTTWLTALRARKAPRASADRARLCILRRFRAGFFRAIFRHFPRVRIARCSRAKRQTGPGSSTAISPSRRSLSSLASTSDMSGDSHAACRRAKAFASQSLCALCGIYPNKPCHLIRIKISLCRDETYGKACEMDTAQLGFSALTATLKAAAEATRLRLLMRCRGRADRHRSHSYPAPIATAAFTPFAASSRSRAGGAASRRIVGIFSPR